MINIKTLRISNDMTQMDLAKLLHVAQGTVAMWETGNSVPRPKLLKKLAKIFNCTIDELLS